MLDALVGREEPEREDDAAAFHAEAVLAAPLGSHRDPVRDDVDLGVVPLGDCLEDRLQNWRAKWRDDIAIDGVELDIEWFDFDDTGSVPAPSI